MTAKPKFHEENDGDHDLLDVLRIQLNVRSLENEAIARYVSNPGNVDAIAGALKAARRTLKGLQGRDMCPPGWHHCPDCSCWPNELECSGAWRPESPKELRDFLAPFVQEMQRLMRALGGEV